MKIGSIGYNYSHGKEFVMDRPNGTGAWLFLLVKTPANFEINGKELYVKANSFVIFSPDTPCKYCAAEEIYTDDWMYFDADDYDFAAALNKMMDILDKKVHKEKEKIQEKK